MSAVLNRTWSHQPWTLVNRLQRDLERTFAREWVLNKSDTGQDQPADVDQHSIDWSPAVDVRETTEAFVLTADVPGVNPKDIEVTMEDGLLTIRGLRQDDAAKEGKEYRRIERVSGRFVRRFSLPDGANLDGVTAKSNHGVLTLTIPKRAEVQPRRIEIQAA